MKIAIIILSILLVLSIGWFMMFYVACKTGVAKLRKQIADTVNENQSRANELEQLTTVLAQKDAAISDFTSKLSDLENRINDVTEKYNKIRHLSDTRADWLNSATETIKTLIVRHGYNLVPEYDSKASYSDMFDFVKHADIKTLAKYKAKAAKAKKEA